MNLSQREELLSSCASHRDSRTHISAGPCQLYSLEGHVELIPLVYTELLIYEITERMFKYHGII
jgi:hypothetical protein